MKDNMKAYTTYTIGRSDKREIQIDDEQVSHKHAEFVVTNDNQFHVTDWASKNGTFQLQGGEWTALRQGFVSETDRLRFGHVEISVQDILYRIGSGSVIPGSAEGTKIRRNTKTGEPEAY